MVDKASEPKARPLNRNNELKEKKKKKRKIEWVETKVGGKQNAQRCCNAAKNSVAGSTEKCRGDRKRKGGIKEEVDR